MDLVAIILSGIERLSGHRAKIKSCAAGWVGTVVNEHECRAISKMRAMSTLLTRLRSSECYNTCSTMHTAP